MRTTFRQLISGLYNEEEIVGSVVKLKSCIPGINNFYYDVDEEFNILSVKFRVENDGSINPVFTLDHKQGLREVYFAADQLVVTKVNKGCSKDDHSDHHHHHHHSPMELDDDLIEKLLKILFDTKKAAVDATVAAKRATQSARQADKLDVNLEDGILTVINKAGEEKKINLIITDPLHADFDPTHNYAENTLGSEIQQLQNDIFELSERNTLNQEFNSEEEYSESSLGCEIQKLQKEVSEIKTETNPLHHEYIQEEDYPEDSLGEEIKKMKADISSLADELEGIVDDLIDLNS